MVSAVEIRTETPTVQAKAGAADQAQSKSGRAADHKEFGRAFSQVVAVLMRDANFRSMRLAELEWLVLPPLLAGQWRVAQAATEPRSAEPAATRSKGGVMMPVGAALWARVSPEVDRRLSDRPEQPLRLQPGEWTSGNINWLIAIAGIPQAIPTFANLLQDREFEGQEVKLRATAPGGSVAVTTLREYARSLADRRKPGSQVP